jgi:hypothetical protein
MAVCYDCSQPIRSWSRRVQLNDGRLVHRACWQSREFFRQYVYQPIAKTRNAKDACVLPADYEIEMVDELNDGLIVVWDFGWASTWYGVMRVITDPSPQGTHHCVHDFCDVSIAPTLS